MASNGGFSMGALILTVLIGFASCSFISEEVFSSHRSTGRSLLQAKTNCPVNFQFLNYTIITSQCKGPNYPPKECCDSLLEFACPYTAVLNDATNDCASIMFSYINTYGKYPPGVFASECQGDKKGLLCPADNSTSLSDNSGNKSGAVVNRRVLSRVGVVLSGVVGLTVLFL